MGKRNNTIIISAVMVAFLLGTLFSSPNYAIALPPWANDILLSITDLDTRVTALESSIPPPSEPTLCDLNGDGAITALELLAYVTSLGFQFTLIEAQAIIDTIENSVVGSNLNGDIDSSAEKAALNQLLLIPTGLEPCA